MRFANAPRKTPQRFERLLPYAIALDVEGVWGERFRNALDMAKLGDEYDGPSWYLSTDDFAVAGLGARRLDHRLQAVSARRLTHLGHPQAPAVEAPPVGVVAVGAAADGERGTG